MNRIRLILSFAVFLVALLLGTGTVILLRQANAAVPEPPQERLSKSYPNFEVDVLVNGRPLQEYYARGRTYIEALQGAEYELRLRNPTSERVAVALSVDGLNTIDARHTSAWNASKWVIEPYQTITISGWQMSSERARRFYFTNERDSYGAKLGQTANLGVISAVFFRERRRVISVTPPYPISRNRDRSDPQQQAGRAEDARPSKSDSAKESRAAAPTPDDEYAATGIGRNVRNDVRWVDMDLESNSAGEVTIRYEYYSALLRLGVVPRQQSREPLQRREDSRGFSPEP
ncbi:MAG TPA: hypothetical protein VFI24_05110 [Pyrinomonadaceae bacterium]|nr:hypothetical protein [Pyrinomonadaceae bacterium]